MLKNVILELTHIVQEVSLIETTSEQVRFIVDSISEVIKVDVCTLYRLNEAGEMEMLATHGLDSTHPLVIPRGLGLVGLVARSRHPLNIEDAAAHPDNFHVPESGEDAVKSFCGVPLVKNGEVTGVLVVQRIEAHKLEDEYEAFLVTLASQLALLVSDISISQISDINDQLKVRGVVGSPGLGIGQVRLSRRAGLNSISDKHCDDTDNQIQQWQQLIRDTADTLDREKLQLGDDISHSVSSIFDVYRMMLSDPSLTQKVEQEIRSGYCVMTALRLSIQYFAEHFMHMDDPYLKARHEDMHFLGNKLYEVWQGEHESISVMENPDYPVVLVGSQITASDICSIVPEQLAGIVSYDGSALSHSAVLANALGIPAIMGTGPLKGISDDDDIIVDANSGEVIVKPLASIAEEYQLLLTQSILFGHQLEALRDQPAITRDGTRIQMLTNTGLQADIQPGLKNGAEGIGLFRTEIPFMIRQSFPTEEEQIEDYRQIFEAYQDKPVYMRTLDVGGDKQLPYFPITGEENPALGWRGIRFTLDNVQLLMTQVRAMIRASAGSDQLHILLPMVSSSFELDSFFNLLDDACDQLEEENIVFKRPKVGVMIEVPAAISQIPLWHDKLDFVSIGSNDLSQYLLALDRNNSRVARGFSMVHPAVIHEIDRIVKLTAEYGIPVSLCGEMAANPVAALLLLGMGMRKLSMSSSKLPRIKMLIRSITIQDAEVFLQQALKMKKADQIYTAGVEKLQQLELGDLLQ